MSTRVCGRCRRPLPAPASEGGAPAPCPFCAAQDAGRAAGRGQPSRAAAPPRDDAGAPKKRAEAFASALTENATRTTPVHSFAVPPEAIPVVNAPRRRDPPPLTPPPIVIAPPPAPVVTILPPSPAPQIQPPPAPPPRRAAAVTATLASLGPGPFTAQTRPSPGASPAMSAAVVAVGAGPAAASMVAAFAELPIVGPSSSHSPYLVPVPTPTPAPIAPAPVAKASTAPSLAETMLAFSPSAPESPEVRQPPRAAAPAPADPPATPGADAWNISSYLEGTGAPPAASATPAFAPAPGAIPEPQASLGSEPVDLQIRGGLSALLHRLSGRGVGAAAVVALLVVAISVGAFVVLGGSPRSGAGKLPETHAAKGPVAPAAAPRVAAAPAPSPRPPSLVMPSIVDPPAAPSAPAALRAEKAEQPEKPAKAERPGKAEKMAKAEKVAPELAPPPVEKEAPRSRAPASSRAHAHVAAKSKATSKHAAHHASSGHGGHRRTTAHATASERSAPADDESDKMARARDAYREGNEKLFSGDGAGAITAYEEMVRLNPKDPAGYRGLGLASAQLGKRTEAVRYLRAYLKHAPNADDRAIIISRISLLQTLPP